MAARGWKRRRVDTRSVQSNVEYILMSGSAKLVAIGVTYPYQVIRSRIQVRLGFPVAFLQVEKGKLIVEFVVEQYQPLPPPASALNAATSVSTSSPSSSSHLRPPPLSPSPPSPSPPPTTIQPYRSIPDVIRRTYAHEGLSGFYKGIGTNAVRILPGTCVTFVVYEQVSRGLSRLAAARRGRAEGERRSGRGEVVEGG